MWRALRLNEGDVARVGAEQDGVGGCGNRRGVAVEQERQRLSRCRCFQHGDTFFVGRRRSSFLRVGGDLLLSVDSRLT